MSITILNALGMRRWGEANREFWEGEGCGCGYMFMLCREERLMSCLITWFGRNDLPVSVT